MKKAVYARIAPDAFDSMGRKPSRSLSAARGVLVEGMSAYAAAKAYGVTQAALSRYLAKLRLPCCPTCGRPLKGTP